MSVACESTFKSKLLKLLILENPSQPQNLTTILSLADNKRDKHYYPDKPRIPAYTAELVDLVDFANLADLINLFNLANLAYLAELPGLDYLADLANQASLYKLTNHPNLKN